MNKKKIVEIEIIRAFAFILVLVEHTIGGYSQDSKAPFDNAVILRFIYTIAKPAVPIFIFISAVSLYYTYRDGINIKAFYKKRLFNLVFPYIICSIIYIIVFHKKIDNIFISLLNGNISYHLWYIGTIIRIYLIFPITLYLLNKLAKRAKVFNIIFISILSIVSYLLIKNKPMIDTYISTIFTHKSIFSIKEFMSISPMYYFIYFILGFYFVVYYDEVLVGILKYKNVIIVLFSIFLIPCYLITMGNRIDFYFNDYIKAAVTICFNIFSIFFWYYISLYMIRIKTKSVNIFKFISHYSFTEYLYHVLIINYIAGILYRYYRLTNNYIFPSVFLCLSAIIIAPIVCHLFSFLPYSKYIFGIKRYR